MKLAEAKALRVLHHHDGGVRHVHPHLDDGDARLERAPELEGCPAAAERMAELFTEAELTFS